MIRDSRFMSGSAVHHPCAGSRPSKLEREPTYSKHARSPSESAKRYGRGVGGHTPHSSISEGAGRWLARGWLGPSLHLTIRVKPAPRSSRGGYCQFVWHIFTESKIPHFRFHFFTLLASQRRVKTTMAARLLRRAFGWFLRSGDSEQFSRGSSHGTRW